MKPLSREELRPCEKCGGGLSRLFYRVTVDRFLVNVAKVRQQHGLELMLGSAELAEAMGPGGGLAEPLDEVAVMLCNDCAMGPQFTVLELLAIGWRRQEAGTRRANEQEQEQDKEKERPAC